MPPFLLVLPSSPTLALSLTPYQELVFLNSTALGGVRVHAIIAAIRASSAEPQLVTTNATCIILLDSTEKDS